MGTVTAAAAVALGTSLVAPLPPARAEASGGELEVVSAELLQCMSDGREVQGVLVYDSLPDLFFGVPTTFEMSLIAGSVTETDLRHPSGAARNLEPIDIDCLVEVELIANVEQLQVLPNVPREKALDSTGRLDFRWLLTPLAMGPFEFAVNIGGVALLGNSEFGTGTETIAVSGEVRPSPALVRLQSWMDESSSTVRVDVMIPEELKASTDAVGTLEVFINSLSTPPLPLGDNEAIRLIAQFTGPLGEITSDREYLLAEFLGSEGEWTVQRHSIQFAPAAERDRLVGEIQLRFVYDGPRTLQAEDGEIDSATTRAVETAISGRSPGVWATVRSAAEVTSLLVGLPGALFAAVLGYRRLRRHPNADQSEGHDEEPEPGPTDLGEAA